MPEQLPAPRFAQRLGHRRRAEQTEDVAPFAHHGGPADEVAEEAVELHHVARQLIAVLAHAGAQHRHGGVAQRFAHFVEAQSVMLDVELGVLPVPPLVGAHRKARRLLLLGRHPREQRVGRLDHRLRRRALGPPREEIGNGLAAGGDAAERLVEDPLPFAEQLFGARARRPRFRMGTGGRPGDLCIGRVRNERMVVVVAHDRGSSIIVAARSSRTPPAARRNPPRCIHRVA